MALAEHQMVLYKNTFVIGICMTYYHYMIILTFTALPNPTAMVVYNRGMGVPSTWQASELYSYYPEMHSIIYSDTLPNRFY